MSVESVHLLSQCVCRGSVSRASVSVQRVSVESVCLLSQCVCRASVSILRTASLSVQL